MTERAAHLGIRNINLNDSQNVDNDSSYEYQDVNFSKIQSPELYFGYELASTSLGNKKALNPIKL